MRSTVRSLLTGFSAALVAFGCADHTTSPGPIRPLSQTRDISDGGHNAGNPHFFFLPPTVSHPVYSGASDGSQTPVVRVCEWQTTGSGAACGPIVANFTTAGGTDGQAVSYDGTSQYGVNWHTNVCVSGPCTLDPTKTYRVRVLVGAQELGHADVQVVSNGSQLKNVQTGDYIGLVDGRTLPVKFRIEQGAINIVPPGTPAAIAGGGGVVESSDGQTSVSIPSGALSSTTNITLQPATNPPAAEAFAQPVDLGPSGTTFAMPVTLTLSFDPTQLPTGVPATALAVYTATADGSGWQLVPNSAVDVSSNTVSAPISHFSTYVIKIGVNTAQGVISSAMVDQNGQVTASGSLCNLSSGGCTPVSNVAVYWGAYDGSIVSVSPQLTTTNSQGLIPPVVVTGLSPGTTIVKAFSQPDGSGAVWATVSVTVTSWFSLASLPSSRWGLSTVTDGNVLYAIGGAMPPTYNFTALSNADVFNPATLTWSPLGSPLPAALAYSNAAILGDSIYVFGGWTCNLCADRRVFSYDIRAASWSRLPDAPFPIYGGAARVIGGKIYMTTGGCCGSSGGFLAFNPASNSWSVLQGPPHAHDFPAGAGVIGGRFYVAGGEGSQGALDVYDPTSGNWASLAAMPVPRQHGAGLTVDGKLYIFGGTNSGSGSDAVDILAFDPPKNAWSTVAQIPVARNLPAAALLFGRAYVAGGTTTDASTALATVEAYPATSKPQPVASVQVVPVAVPASSHLVAGHLAQFRAILYDGNGAILSGRAVAWQSSAPGVATVDVNGLVTAVDVGTVTITATSEFLSGTVTLTVDPAWSTGAPLLTARRSHSVVAFNGGVYAIGGYNNGNFLASVEAYDATHDVWQSKTPMQFARMQTAVSVDNNKMYVAGGFNQAFAGGANTPDGTLATLEIYNAATDTWTTAASMQTPRRCPSSAVINGKFYVVGGANTGNATPVADLEMYDPALGSWVYKTPMPTARFCAGSAVINGLLYVVGGFSNGPNSLTNVEVYDPVQNTWSTTYAPMPTPRYGFGIGYVNGLLYVAGGNNAGVVFNVVEAYNPVTNKWGSAPHMPTARSDMDGAVFSGRFFVIGGTTINTSANWIGTNEILNP
jgi:N-acetylneuraminic acid mutarotase